MNGPMNGPSSRLTQYEHAGLVFDVLDEGPVDGEVVVLLHGFPERASCWREVAPLLHAQGYRTLAPDQRGYSPGARPRGRRSYHTGLLAGDVVALIAQATGPGGRAHVVGHDWGAIVAWTVAAMRPDLVATLTALSVPHPSAFLASLVRSRQGLRSWYMGLFQLPRVPELLAAMPGGLFEALLRRSGMSKNDVARFHTEILEYGALPGGLAYYRALPFVDRSLLEEKIAVPTTMIWSDGDDFLDRSGVERTEQHVAAPYELVVLTGLSHWLPTQAPEAVTEAILERVTSV